MLHLIQLSRKIALFIFFFVAIVQVVFSQNSHVYNHDDTLRGAITKQRAWWDVTHYTLKIKPDVDNQTIQGVNFIRFKTLKSDSVLQIDLQPDLKIDSVMYESQKCKIYDAGTNAHLVTLPNICAVNSVHEIGVFYHGRPHVATNPPWEGGFQWGKNDYLPYIATSCQGLGASSWWPCKDHQSDEADSMQIEITVPKELIAVSNGRLQRVITETSGDKTYVWAVKNPINNYGVNLNIANYAHFSDAYVGEKGKLTLEYYVLPENLARAQQQFKQVKNMLKAFEYWFGAYPFYEDGYKIVEVPYLGMEHQSDISYGNGYVNGYRGSDLSRTGWGENWDYIIVHESGHEWFGNSITSSDIADMWIHESFTTYSESLFIEYFNGKKAGSEYNIGNQFHIYNIGTIVGDYNVNKEPSSDMYWKGASMLNTLRYIVNNDSLWRKILRGLNTEFYHKVVSTKQIEDYISKSARLKLNSFFNQYLRDIKIPILEYKFSGKTLLYRFTHCQLDFEMPIEIKINKDSIWRRTKATTKWQKLTSKHELIEALSINPNFYITSKEIK